MARRGFKAWLRDDRASAGVEAGILFPLMVAVLCGSIDMGIGLVTNLKVTTACQTVADLVSRDADVTDLEIEDAIVAGRMALMPYDTTTYGIDIAGIQFDGDDAEPVVRWRETRNMEPNDNILDRSEGLGLEDEGIVAVTVRYVYTPMFSSFMLDTIDMGEEAYVRGRKGLFVERE